jgi:GAF domain-containing protein
MITAFANQAAIAIENARLFGQVRAELVETQKEARQIFIQIDEGKTSRHLEEIINTDFFKKLRDAANSDEEQ